MGEVTRLFHAEEIRLDRSSIHQLVSELGEGGAERVICRSMEEIAVRLTRIENAFCKGAIERVASGAQGLVSIAEQTGLMTLRDIAQTVVSLAETNDSAALSANVARLIRVGEMSLVTVWDVHDISV